MICFIIVQEKDFRFRCVFFLASLRRNDTTGRPSSSWPQQGGSFDCGCIDEYINGIEIIWDRSGRRAYEEPIFEVGKFEKGFKFSQGRFVTTIVALQEYNRNHHVRSSESINKGISRSASSMSLPALFLQSDFVPNWYELNTDATCVLARERSTEYTRCNG